LPPRSATRGPVCLTEVCVEAVLKAWAISMGPRVPEPLFCGNEGV
jgi:hypothetical protein